ncbi:hypothetical protein [Paraburkholderia gardini]|uniref:Uncharacterized protein n=1 Tax=Paraburkholderia gardini TaxID=2823469 RepID=A0ABN7QPF4_9BURK|nr:hypothetical protein R54767_03160 [Paraburkholderia gardini]CAG4924639.1 hypothetical protein R69919_05226 [Paraburkholderia gardini]
MITRNIQTFMMVSAAFFAVSAPAHPNSASTLATAAGRTIHVAFASRDADRPQASQATQPNRRS